MAAEGNICPYDVSVRQGARRMEFGWTQGALAEGLRLYHAGEFFAAHEAWESLWLGAQEPEKTFLQGLIQVTAAFHHLQRENPLGTARLLQAALERLEHYPAHFGSISVALLCNDVRQWLQALQAAAPAPHFGPARIQPWFL
jgi:predicted metal-dependent hydrolase